MQVCYILYCAYYASYLEIAIQIWEIVTQTNQAGHSSVIIIDSCALVKQHVENTEHLINFLV